jgi:hypothetical protein
MDNKLLIGLIVIFLLITTTCTCATFISRCNSHQDLILKNNWSYADTSNAIDIIHDSTGIPKKILKSMDTSEVKDLLNKYCAGDVNISYDDVITKENLDDNDRTVLITMLNKFTNLPIEMLQQQSNDNLQKMLKEL